MKKSAGGSVLKFIAGVAVSFMLFMPAAVSNPSADIAVLTSGDVKQYEEALDGFKEILGSNSIKYSIVEFDLKKEKDPEKLIKKLLSEEPHLVLAMGSQATELIKEKIGSVPIVFSMVLNPVSSGFVKSIASPGGNIPGSSLDISLKTQFEEFKKMVPGLKKVAVLYNPGETKMVVDNAGSVARGMGIELLPIKVLSEKDVPEAMKAVSKDADALWAVADSTVFTKASSEYILLETLRNKIPFMGLSPAFVKAGALFSLSWDYTDIGRQSGEIALKILKGEEASAIPVSVPRSVKISVNNNTASRIGVKIPSDILKNAKEVF
ncbi:MAG: hypothetical protein AUJ75_01350 [Candidatus Omnitrophica bacterium CG1_02_49_10]|nr:MAG: hypothetical protein AUJ75_01350 [Candidatus Omnitrophica bacterium CG1_02_49_10]